jgi:hypothetical protein
MKILHSKINTMKFGRNVFQAYCYAKSEGIRYNPIEISQKGNSEKDAVQKLEKFLGDNREEVELESLSK